MMATEEENGVISDGCKQKELDKGTENQDVTEMVVLDSDASETYIDDEQDDLGDTGGSSCSSCASRPVPPFLLKIYDMLGNDETNSLVSWAHKGTSFVIRNPHLFASKVLPMYFRHRNFHSFITQLNSYGFKKISWEQWEYRNDYFRKGERHLLRNIKRRNQISHRVHPTYVDASSCSSDKKEKELAILVKEHNLLKAEIVKLKEKQDIFERKIASLKHQAVSNEEDQKRMMLQVLSNLLDLNNTETPMMDDDRETFRRNLKGKRKLEETSTTAKLTDHGSGSATCKPNVPELISERYTGQGKTVMDEGEMGKHPSNTFIPLEDLIGEFSDWAEYIKEMQDKASHVKP